MEQQRDKGTAHLC